MNENTKRELKNHLDSLREERSRTVQRLIEIERKISAIRTILNIQPTVSELPNVYDQIEYVLRRSGKPMTTQEISKELRALGVGDTKRSLRDRVSNNVWNMWKSKHHPNIKRVGRATYALVEDGQPCPPNPFLGEHKDVKST